METEEPVGVSLVEQRWASIKLTLLLLCLGVLPLTPEIPIPFAFVVLTAALVAAAPFVLRFARFLSRRICAPAPRAAIAEWAAAGWWRLRARPIAPGTPGTVRSRAPSRLIAAHG